MLHKKNRKKNLYSFFAISFTAGSLFLVSSSPLFAQLQLQIPVEKLVAIPADQMSKGAGITVYLAAIYTWLVAAITLLAALFIMIGGLIWLTAAGSSKKIGEAKKIIMDSLIGLGLALGSFLFLSTLNSGLVNFKGIGGVENIEKTEMESKEAAMEAQLDKQTQTSRGTPLSGGGEIANLRSQGKIRTQCVGPGSCSGQKSGEWDRGLAGSGGNPVDSRIRGAIEFVAKTCGPITITGLNEKFGHSDGSKHYRGMAVDIGGTICGASPNSCTDRQLQLVVSLRKLGYGIGTPGGRCGGFKDGPGHFHIQIP